MSKTIQVEVGDFYAELHEHYSESAGEEYTGRVREQFEDFLHNFNKTVERQLEEQEQEQYNIQEQAEESE